MKFCLATVLALVCFAQVSVSVSQNEQFATALAEVQNRIHEISEELEQPEIDINSYGSEIYELGKKIDTLPIPKGLNIFNRRPYVGIGDLEEIEKIKNQVPAVQKDIQTLNASITELDKQLLGIVKDGYNTSVKSIIENVKDQLNNSQTTNAPKVCKIVEVGAYAQFVAQSELNFAKCVGNSTVQGVAYKAGVELLYLGTKVLVLQLDTVVVRCVAINGESRIQKILGDVDKCVKAEIKAAKYELNFIQNATKKIDTDFNATKATLIPNVQKCLPDVQKQNKALGDNVTKTYKACVEASAELIKTLEDYEKFAQNFTQELVTDKTELYDVETSFLELTKNISLIVVDGEKTEVGYFKTVLENIAQVKNGSSPTLQCNLQAGANFTKFVAKSEVDLLKCKTNTAVNGTRYLIKAEKLQIELDRMIARTQIAPALCIVEHPALADFEKCIDDEKTNLTQRRTDVGQSVNQLVKGIADFENGILQVTQTCVDNALKAVPANGQKVVDDYKKCATQK